MAEDTTKTPLIANQNKRLVAYLSRVLGEVRDLDTIVTDQIIVGERNARIFVDGTIEGQNNSDLETRNVVIYASGDLASHPINNQLFDLARNREHFVYWDSETWNSDTATGPLTVTTSYPEVFADQDNHYLIGVYDTHVHDSVTDALASGSWHPLWMGGTVIDGSTINTKSLYAESIASHTISGEQITVLQSSDLFSNPSGVLGDGIVISATGIEALRDDTRTFFIQANDGSFTAGRVAASQNNIYYTPATGKMQFRVNTTVKVEIDTAGVITVGEVATNKLNIQINPTTIDYRNNAVIYMSTGVGVFTDVESRVHSGLYVDTTPAGDDSNSGVLLKGDSYSTLELWSNAADGNAANPGPLIQFSINAARTHVASIYVSNELEDEFVIKSTSGTETFTDTRNASNRYTRMLITSQNITTGTKYTDYYQDVATTNATVTTIWTFATAASTSYMVKAFVIARRTGGSSVTGVLDDAAGYEIVTNVRQQSGTLGTVASSSTWGNSGEDQTAWDASFSISSNNLLLRVTGAADTNIDWTAHIRVYETTT